MYANMKLVKLLELNHIYESPAESSVEEGEIERNTVFERKFSFNFLIDKPFIDNYFDYHAKIVENHKE